MPFIAIGAPASRKFSQHLQTKAILIGLTKVLCQFVCNITGKYLTLIDFQYVI